MWSCFTFKHNKKKAFTFEAKCQFSSLAHFTLLILIIKKSQLRFLWFSVTIVANGPGIGFVVRLLGMPCPALKCQLPTVTDCRWQQVTSATWVPTTPMESWLHPRPAAAVGWSFGGWFSKWRISLCVSFSSVFQVNKICNVKIKYTGSRRGSLVVKLLALHARDPI